MNLDNKDLRYKAILSSINCVPFKDDNPIESLTISDNFDLDYIINFIEQSEKLLTIGFNFTPLLAEILQVLHDNGNEFLLWKQKQIGFYWHGNLILKIINNSQDSNKIMYISMHKYQIEKESKISEKKNNRIIMAGLGGSLLIATVITTLSFLKK